MQVLGSLKIWNYLVSIGCAEIEMCFLIARFQLRCLGEAGDSFVILCVSSNEATPASIRALTSATSNPQRQVVALIRGTPT